MSKKILDMRDVFFKKTADFMRRNKNIILLTNDMGAPSLDFISNNFPNQIINMGITEQNIISTAAGLASAGKKVIVYSISTFITLRSLEQIKLDLCVMNLPAIIVTVGAGYSYAVDGPTHHAIDDISVMNSLANLNIFCPSDPNHLSKITSKIFRLKNVSYLRLDRGKWNSLKTKKNDFSNGFRVVKKGTDICVITIANMVHKLMGIANKLNKHQINLQIIDLFQIKPLNVKKIVPVLKKFNKICIIEEHSINGGLGSILLKNLHDKVSNRSKFLHIGIEDKNLYTYGMRDNIHKASGLSDKNLIGKIKKFSIIK